MSKRSFPFDNCAPLQLKTHVESKHVNNNEADMQQIYGKLLSHHHRNLVDNVLITNNLVFCSQDAWPPQGRSKGLRQAEQQPAECLPKL